MRGRKNAWVQTADVPGSLPGQSGTTSRTSAPAANSTSRIMCPFRTDRSAVRCSLSSPFMIPQASPSVTAHPCCSHFHLEHELKHVFVSRRVPCASGCSLLSRSNSAARRSSCSSAVTIPPFRDMEATTPRKASSHCRLDERRGRLAHGRRVAHCLRRRCCSRPRQGRGREQSMPGRRAQSCGLTDVNTAHGAILSLFTRA